MNGNGNKVVIVMNFIEYNPIKPAFSSSGTYDDENYVKKSITSIQFNKIKHFIDECVNYTINHVKDGVKLGGIIIIKEGNNETIFILGPNSRYFINIKKTFHEIIGN